MKKLLSLFLCICLFGCSTKVKNETTVCTYNSDLLKITNTLVSLEDKLIKQTNVNEMDFSAYGYDAASITQVAESYRGIYEQIGVEYSFEINGNVIKETIVIDYEKADFDDLLEAGLITSSEDEKITYVSLEKTVDASIEQGLTCK